MVGVKEDCQDEALVLLSEPHQLRSGLGLVVLALAGGSAAAGTAVATPMIQSEDIVNGTIRSEDIKNGQVKSEDIWD
jgi:hypothetical protein